MNQLLEEFPNYRIPMFQRPFVWNQKMISDLVDSIARGYSPGMILLWKKENDNIELSCDEEIEWEYSSSVEYFLLDGQQRLRTLFSIFTLPTNQNVRTNIKKARNTNTAWGKASISPKIFNNCEHSNRILNKSGTYVDFDIFLDLKKLSLVTGTDYYNAFDESCFVSIREIEKLKDDNPSLILTDLELVDLRVNSFFAIPDYENKKWISSNTRDDPNYTEIISDKKIRYIWIGIINKFDTHHILQGLGNININGFELNTSRNDSIQIANGQILDYLISNIISPMRTNFRNVDIGKNEVRANNLSRLTHYFSRINLAGLPLDVVDLVTANIYRIGEESRLPNWAKANVNTSYSRKPYVLRQELLSLFNHGDTEKKAKLISFFKLKDIEDDSSKYYKLLLQSIRIATSNGTDGILDKDVLGLNIYDFIDSEFSFIKFKARARSKVVNALISSLNDFTANNVNNISELRYDRIFPILVALNYNNCFSGFRNKNKFITNWLMFEFFSDDLFSGGQRPKERYNDLKDVLRNYTLEIFKTKVPSDLPTYTYTNQPKSSKALKYLMLENKAIDFHLNKLVIDVSITSSDIDLHHIFPKEYLEPLRLEKKEVNSGLNMTLLHKDTNNTIKSKSPFDYILDLENRFNATIANKILKSHEIPSLRWWKLKDRKLKSNNPPSIESLFREFKKKRYDLLCNKLKTKYNFS